MSCATAAKDFRGKTRHSQALMKAWVGCPYRLRCSRLSLRCWKQCFHQAQRALSLILGYQWGPTWLQRLWALDGTSPLVGQATRDCEWLPRGEVSTEGQLGPWVMRDRQANPHHHEGSEGVACGRVHPPGSWLKHLSQPCDMNGQKVRPPETVISA